MVITTKTKELLVSFLGGNTETAPTHIAFGTTTTTPNEENITLGTENIRLTTTDTSATGKEISFSTTLASTQASGETLAEMGLFNANSAGTMFVHSTYTDITKTTSFEIQATITMRID